MTTDKTSTAPVKWRFDPAVIDYDQYRERLRSMNAVRSDGGVDDNIIADMMILLNDIERGKHLPTPDVVGGDVVAFRFIRADGHKYTWVDASEMARNGRPEDVLAEGERIEYAYAAPRVQGDVSHPAEQTRGNGVDIAKQIRGSIIRRLDAFHESNPSSWCGYLDDALGAAEVIAENLEASVAPRQAVPDELDLLQLIRDARHRICNDAAGKANGQPPKDHPVYGPLLRRLDEADAMLAAAPSAGRMGVDRG